MNIAQLDLFVQNQPRAPVVTTAQLREEERFGRWDAICGLPLCNPYRSQLSELRAEAYDRGWHVGVQEWAPK